MATNGSGRDGRSDDWDDDETPTRPLSGSYSVFRDEALRVALMLDNIVLTSRKRVDLYDAGRIRAGELIALRLRDLAARFDRWPSLPAPQVSAERLVLPGELARHLRAALVLLEAMPTAGALGPRRGR